MFFGLLIPAFLVSGHQIDHLLGRWGYAVVFIVVLAQASGVPVPGTTVLAAAAVYAATTHRLAIAWVIIAAAAGVNRPGVRGDSWPWKIKDGVHADRSHSWEADDQALLA